MNDNVKFLAESVQHLQHLALVLMRSIQTQSSGISIADLSELRRLEALARQGTISNDLADAIAATRRVLLRPNEKRAKPRRPGTALTAPVTVKPLEIS